jgi:regulator of sirC expression with transglutaminase-like and TPR domain
VPAGTGSAAGAGSSPAAPTASPSQLYKEGAQLTLAGKLAEAQKKYIAALRISPGYAPALRGLGLVYEKSGQKAKAIKSLQAYLRLAPKAADAAAIRTRIERLRN